jgi:hypothetical protein
MSGEIPAFGRPRGFRKLFQQFIKILTTTDTTLAEFASSTTLILIGGVLAQPGAQLTANTPLFVLMLHVAPEWVWALVLLAVGALQSAGNLVHGMGARRVAAMLSFIAFGFVCVLGLSVTPLSILGATLGVQAFVMGIVYLRLGVSGAG